MKHWLLALTLLGGWSAVAHAEYVILITNLGQKPESAAADPMKNGPRDRPMPNDRPKGDREPSVPAAEAILVTAIIEVTPKNPGGLTKKELRLFNAGAQQIALHHPWSRTGFARVSSYKLFETFKDLEVGAAFQVDEGQTAAFLAPVARRYSLKFDGVFNKGTLPDYESAKKLAQWTLEHGLLKEFAEVMDRLGKTEYKTQPEVAAYLDLKERLRTTTLKVPGKSKLTNLLGKYDPELKLASHFVIYYREGISAAVLKDRADRLEDSFKAFYYWFALQGQRPRLPTERLLVLLESDEKEFKKVEQSVSATPRVADGFFARRENLVVLSSRPLGQDYDLLLKKSNPLWDNKFNRYQILHAEKDLAGIPLGATVVQMANARMWALMLRSMENDSEVASLTHAVGRQLAFSTDLLPRNVTAPEWVQFGLGSFFETPAGSPWPGGTGVNQVHMHAWRELREGRKDLKLESDNLETLRKVVTDSYFRQEGQTPADRAALQRRARATSWALTWYLLQNRQAKYREFLKALGRMPRDLELDGEVIWDCFTSAFGEDQVKGLADKWFDEMKAAPFEAEELFKIADDLQEWYKKMTPPPDPKDNKGGMGKN